MSQMLTLQVSDQTFSALERAAEATRTSPAALYQSTPVRLTHSYILAEFVALAHVRRLPRQQTRMFVSDLIDNFDIETVWVDQLLHREAMALLVARPDKTYSLCDAASFVLLRRHNLVAALTTDRHFEQEGFRRLLA